MGAALHGRFNLEGTRERRCSWRKGCLHKLGAAHALQYVRRDCTDHRGRATLHGLGLHIRLTDIFQMDFCDLLHGRLPVSSEISRPYGLDQFRWRFLP